MQPTSSTTEDEATVADRIADVSIPLETVDPAGSFDDLQPLQRAFEGAKIVGLGESTHGTREFIRTKHRLLKFLVEELGVRMIALESSFSEALALNEYIVHGDGSLRVACDALSYWMYDAESMRSVIAWARAHNEGASPSETIRFYGFDIGSERATDAPAYRLRRYLESVDPDALARYRDTLDRLVADESDRADEATLENRLDLIPEFVDEIGTLLTDRRPADSSSASTWQWKLATRCLRELEQLYEANRGSAADTGANVGGLRDRFMAENVSWLLDNEGADRAVLWSHNGHVMNACRDQTGPVMGRHLTEAYGDAYYPLALTFGRGSFRATAASDGRQQQFTLERPVEHTLPATLATVGESLFALDFETALADPQLASHFETSRPIHEIGSTFDPDWAWSRYYCPVELADAFDGLVFIETSTPSIPVGEERCL